MPKKKQPPCLEALALQAVGMFVREMGRLMIEPVCTVSRRDSAEGIRFLQAKLDRLNELLYASVPWYLFDKMAHQVLSSIADLIMETKSTFTKFESQENKSTFAIYDSMSLFVNHMNVVVKLTEVALHPHLRNIDFSLWPKIMRHVLFKNLHKMTGLEGLNLGSASGGWKTSDMERSIIQGVTSMKNLTSLCLCFDCTDHILSLVSLNCKKLQKLDVTASRSVTDRSVSYLQSCQKLKEVHLYRTSVSVEGYAQLLLKLPLLEDFGRCDEFGQVLEYVRSIAPCNTQFGFRIFQSRDVTTFHLNLLIEMCPKVTHVSIYHDERVSDLTVLAALDDMTELKLLSCDFFTDRVKQLLEMKGCALTWLHLEHVEEIDLNALIYISQFCPNLKKLVFYNCEFLDHTSLSMKKMTVPPFQNLEHIMCIADCGDTHLEFLLSNCFNIKFIQLGSSTGIGDQTMAKVLLRNPMKYLEKLKILYSDNLSMQTVHLLMTHCTNLRVLSELESWQGITAAELNSFRQYIKENNIDLDVRPTLSYY
ncbi:uncharacterized protein [Anabrus simplex]|uniref:uncharacterized protein isoform X1 n=1 Tax=Anabrus simplex TaxID=316456 RepID=UPI0034DD0D1E